MKKLRNEPLIARTQKNPGDIVINARGPVMVIDERGCEVVQRDVRVA